MKPDTRTVKELFERDVRYVVPLYQRPYVWSAERQWQPLWEDIEAILEQRLNGGSGDGFSHFLGAIVLDQVIHAPGAIPLYTIIDGQQRLTTLQLLLGAASNTADGAGSDKEAAILGRLTRNDELTAEGVEVFKVWPTNANRTAFAAVMEVGGPSGDREDDPHNRIDEAYAFFCATINDWLAEEEDAEARLERLTLLRTTLSDLLKVVSITLEPGDNAQVIFETLNARGTPLLALDLVKNLVFHEAERQSLDVETLYFDVWEPELDQAYWRTDQRQGRLNRPRADLFLMHWLAMKLHEVVPASELFVSFRQRVLGTATPPPADELIRELRRDAEIMRSFDHQPPGSAEASFFARLDLLDTSVLMPLVLLLFRDSRITVERRRRALRVLESWLVRRALMRLTVKAYNQQIPLMLARVSDDPEHADDVLIDYLRAGVGEISRWPNDEELRKALTTKGLYKNVAGKLIVLALAAIEETFYTAKVDIPVIPKTLSLEHVIPQSWEEHWPLPDGEDPIVAKEKREERIHRLGNLTLTAAPLNSSLSNAAWTKKRKELNKATRLLLNVELIDDHPEAFDEAAIDARGAVLADRILALWPGPEAWQLAEGQVAAAGTEAAAPESSAATVSVSGDGAPALPELAQVGGELDGAGAMPVADVEHCADLLRDLAPVAQVDVVKGRRLGMRARLELEDAVTVKYAYLDTDLPGEIPLRLYPGDTLEQARILYADRDRCTRMLALRERGWEVEPNFHFGFMTRGLTWTRSKLTADEYVDYWIDRIEATTAMPRADWDAELQRLIENGIFDPDDVPQFHIDFADTARTSASPRPGLALTHRWPAGDSLRSGFTQELRAALWEALTALSEPLSALSAASTPTA
jgi:hypothetical protein